ncbi:MULTISPECIES: hypothetical protein [unclassified Pseudomonas]|uniref:hypothetical protein n=1 Tax=unclassified Pseudomonas TaxID=196821 RepID=UPI001CBB819D|nr:MULTISPECIES: hypothetical protein [unclassified Pseudomonas]
MKTITDEISKKQMYVLAFAPYITIWFWVFCIIMAVVWYFSKSSLIGFVSAIAIPALLIKFAVDKKVTVINKLLGDVYAKTMSSLQNIDYYFYNADGSIAVDSKTGTLSYIKILPTMEVLPPVIIKASDILEYYFYNPGMTTTKYYGRDMAVAQEVLIENLEAIGARAKERGIHMKVNDLQHPKIVMNMTAKDAEYWTLILSKLLDGSLEPSSSPKLIP